MAKRKPSRKTLVKKLDKVVGDYIKKRDTYRCVQCGSGDKPSWGHVFSRRSYSTRWDVRNSFCQCWPCNFKHSKDNYDYYKWFQDRFGMDAFDQLRRDYLSAKPFKNFELQELIEEFKAKIEELDKCI